MLKLVFPLRRLPTLSREEFQRYWYETHGPLVRRHAKALRIRRYVQLHTLDDPINAALQESRGAEEPYDGVAELWWESRADLERSEEHTSELQSRLHLVCRLLLEKKKKKTKDRSNRHNDT